MRLKEREPQLGAGPVEAERPRQDVARVRLWFKQGFSLLAVVLFHLLIFGLLTLEARSPPLRTPPSTEMISLMLGSPGTFAARKAAPPSGGQTPPPASPALSPSQPPALPPSQPSAPSLQAPSEEVKSDTAAAPPIAQPPDRETGPVAAGIAEEPSGGCNLERQLQGRLAGDPAVVSSLEHMPPGARSVANAVQLWDGHWITPAKLQPAALLDPVKVAIFQTVAAAKSSCFTVAIQGPRLIFVPAGDRTFIISLGSGSWRWTDLTAP